MAEPHSRASLTDPPHVPPPAHDTGDDLDAGDLGGLGGMQDISLTDADETGSTGDVGEAELHAAGMHEPHGADTLPPPSEQRASEEDDAGGDIGAQFEEEEVQPASPVSPTVLAPAPEREDAKPEEPPAATSPTEPLSTEHATLSSPPPRRSQTVSPIRIVTSSDPADAAAPLSPEATMFRKPRPTSVISVASVASVRSTGSGVGASPVFRTVPVPHAAATAAEDEGSPDESAPFESIPIDEGAPGRSPVLATVAVHARSDSRHSFKRHSKRDSWGGFGVDANGNHVAHGVLPVHTDPPALTVTTNGNGSSGGGTGSVTAPAGGGVTSRVASPTAPASGGSTPRRHAPPAHPHPFPLPGPTSPSTHTSALPAAGSVVHSAPASSSSTPHLHHTPALGAKGASAIEKFISRTRPSHLPPKNKQEDEEHLHEWEHMMAKSREHETERRKVEELKNQERERHIATVTPRWEALLSDFNAAKVRDTPSLRSLWFEGIPPQLRGRAWTMAIGNQLALHKDAYRTYHRRAQRAMDMNRFPPDILQQLDADLDETLVPLHVFHRGSPMRDDLRQLICAWVVYRSDEGRGYAPYITRVAAMFLLVSPPEVAFNNLLNFLARSCLSAFYTNTKDEIDGFYRVFENLQADMFPRIFANCKNLGLRLPESYFRSVLVEQVPFVAVCRLWDQIMLDGDGFIFRAALAIFGFLEPRLYFPDYEEILSVLEGRNKATQAITERERERARLRGEQYDAALDGRLSVFGLYEDPLFEWLASDGWKESRYLRLVNRELPD